MNETIKMIVVASVCIAVFALTAYGAGCIFRYVFRSASKMLPKSPYAIRSTLKNLVKRNLGVDSPRLFLYVARESAISFSMISANGVCLRLP